MNTCSPVLKLQVFPSNRMFLLLSSLHQFLHFLFFSLFIVLSRSRPHHINHVKNIWPLTPRQNNPSIVFMFQLRSRKSFWVLTSCSTQFFSWMNDVFWYLCNSLNVWYINKLQPQMSQSHRVLFGWKLIIGCQRDTFLNSWRNLINCLVIFTLLLEHESVLLLKAANLTLFLSFLLKFIVLVSAAYFAENLLSPKVWCSKQTKLKVRKENVRMI